MAIAVPKDPVCGMDVDPKQAVASNAYHGKTYYFCSAVCAERFEADPERYVHEGTAQSPRYSITGKLDK